MEARTGNRRVLLAEGDGPRAGRLVRVLESHGYDVVLSACASEVRERLRDEPFGALIGDWSLGGDELLSDLRSDGRRYTYAIVTSTSPGDMTQAMAAGADDFLLKPLDAGALLARMRVADRIGRMQEAIATQNEELFETNRRLQRVNARMRRELEAAADVQQALLPRPGFRVPGTRIAWRLRPCHELAGDILNCLRLDEHHVAFYVLDVSGHGVSSALLSVQVARLMSPVLAESELLKRRLDRPPWYRIAQPLDVLQRLNELFQLRGGPAQYFTIVYGVLHVASGRLSLAAGGHPGPILVPATGDPVALPCRSHPVGLLPRAKFFARELHLDVGDRIWLYSDGVTDATNAAGDSLETEWLRSRALARRDDPVEAAVACVMSEVERFTHPDEPADDCTLLVIEREGPAH